MNEEAEKAFTPGPMTSVRSARKSSSYLVRAKLYSIERTVASQFAFKIGKKLSNLSECKRNGYIY